MKISHIEHLGIAVQSIEESLPFFTDVLGLECYATEVVEDQKVKTAFLKCGEVKVARQGQQGRSPCSILHRGWCCQRVGRSQREGRTSHRPGTS